MNRPVFHPSLIGLVWLIILSTSVLVSAQTAKPVVNGADPRYETLPQNQISMLFDNNGSGSVTLAGSATAADFQVRINGSGVGISITSVSVVLPDRVLITANVSGFAGHGGTQNFFKPGEVVTVSFSNASGTLKTAVSNNNALATAGFVAAKNNFSPSIATSCNEFGKRSIGVWKTPDVCAPVVADFVYYQYEMSLRYRNSSFFATNPPVFYLNYHDAPQTTNSYSPIQVDNSANGGVASATYFESSLTVGGGGVPVILLTAKPNDFTYNIPPAGNNICGFTAEVWPVFQGVKQCNTGSLLGNFGFKSYSNDNSNTDASGILAFTYTTGVGRTTNRVCPGTNLNTLYTDNTNLNCAGPPIPASAGSSPNTGQRWIRITYGYQNSPLPQGNIPNVVVNAVNVTNSAGVISPAGGYFPTSTTIAGAPVDANGVIDVGPLSAATASTYILPITTSTFANQAQFQRFYVRIEYWNVCNPYDGTVGSLANAVTINDYIELIAKPAPLTSSGLSICYNAGNSNAFNFTVSSSAAGRTAVNWYKNLASVGGTPMNPTGNSLTFPAASYTVANGAIGAPFSSNNVNGKIFSVFATQVVGGTSVCESPPIEVVIIQQPQISAGADVPTAPSGLASICNGTTGVAYTTSSPLGTDKTIAINTATNTGGSVYLPVQNVWTHGFGAGVTMTPASGIGNGVTMDYAFGAQPNPSTTANLSVSRRYITSTNIPVVSAVPAPYTVPTYNINPQACANGPVNLSVTVWGTSDGGTITGSPTICDGASTGNMTLSGHRGAVLQWERSFNGGAFVAIAGTAGLTTFSEVPPNGAGPYKYRALVQNQNASGPCASATTIVANQNLVTVNPVPPKPTITPSGVTTFCLGGSVTLTSSNTNASTYLWFKNGVSTGITTQNIVLNTVAQSGDYTVQVIGVAPSLCTSVVSDPTTVTINPLPTVSGASGGGAVCTIAGVPQPAPPISFTLTGTPPFTLTYTITAPGPGTFSGINEPTNTFTIPAPNVIGTYRITSLVDANGCVATALAPTAAVTVGGTAPTFATGPSLTPTATCVNGASTTDPQLNFTLDAGSASLANFTLTYKIDGGSNATKTFSTNAASAPTAAITFTEAALNGTAPSPHTITIVSIQSNAGCLSIFNTPLSFTVNPLPSAPTGGVPNTYCSNPNTPGALSVANPGAGLTIDWYQNASGGAALATGTLTYTPTLGPGNYFAETRNTVTGCVSATRTSVASILDTQPATASAGPNQTSICSSAGSVTLAAGAVGSGGIGSWSVNTKVAYYQNFANFANGVTRSSAGNGWSIDTSNPNAYPQQGSPGSSYFEVRSNRFEAANTNGNLGAGGANQGEVVWLSPIINIASITSVAASVDVINVSGGLSGADDNISVFYRLNGSTSDVAFTTNGSNSGNFANATASVTGLSGAQLQIVVRIRNDGAADKIGFDNVIIREASAAGAAISFANPNSPTTTVSGLPAPADGAAPITTTLTWTSASALGVCPSTTSTVDITINPAPKLVAAQSTSVCSGTAVNYEILLSPANFPAASTFTWVDPDGAGPATSKTNLAADPAGTKHITDVLVNTSGATTFVDYQVQPKSALGCVGVTTAVRVNTLPAPKLNTPQAKTICSGQAVNYEILMTPANQPAGTTYSWLDPDGPAAPGTAKTIAADPAGTKHITDVLTNFTAGAITTTYVVTPTGPGPSNCVGANQNVVITVNPNPVANPVVGSSNVCAGSTVLLYQVTPNAGSTYAWTVPAPFVKFGGGTPTDFFVLVQFPVVGSGNITMTETNSFGCVGTVNSLAVNVANAPGALSINGADPVCKNQIGVAYSVAAPTPGSTYNWSASGATITSAASGPNLTTISVDFGLAAAATITVSEVSTSGCTGTPFTKNISVSNIPTMTSANSQSICSGTTPSLAFGASIPSNFSWEVTSITGAITAATAPALAVGNTGTGNLGATFTGAQALINNSSAVGSVTFDVTPSTSAAPFCQGPTQSVVITVNPKPVIPAQVATICSGATFSVVPVDGNPTAATIVPTGTTYTWTAPVVSGGITGGSAQVVPTTSISQALTNPTNTVQSATYTVTPTSGAAGTCVGTSFTVTVTVNPKPVIPAQTATICSGTSFTVTPANGVPAASTIVPTGTTYTWGAPVVTGGITGGSAQVIGQPNISQTLTNPTSIPQTATYTVTPTSGAAGACIGSTFNVTVTVNPTPVIPIQTTTVCSATPFIISPADGVPTAATVVPAGTTYTWTAPVVTGGMTGGSAQAAPQATISQTLSNPTSSPQTATYTVTPTSGAAGSCVGAPFTVTVTVNPSPAIPAQALTICSTGTFTLTPTNGVPTAATVVPSGTTYTWTNPVVTGGIIGGSAQAFGQPQISQTLTNPTNAVQTATYTVTPTSGAAGTCVGPNFTLVVTVNPMPVIPNQVASICSGTAFNIAPANGIPSAATIVPTATTYTWTAPVVTGGVTGGSAQAVGQPNISQTLTNPTNTPQTATYTVTPTSGAAGACVGANFTVTVTINPKPVIANQTPSICSGAAFTITPADGVPSAATIVPAGTTYTWAAPIVTGGVTGASAQAIPQPNISQTLTNPTNAVQTVTYTVTPTSGASGACVGSNFTITVTVNPKPVIPAQTATICSGAAFSITPADGVPTAATIVPTGTTYTWPAPVVSGGITGGSAQLIGAASISQTLTNPTSVVQTATYTVTPTSGAAGACVGSTFTVTVTVNPKPVIANQTASICSGTAFSITPTDGLPTAATIVPLGTTYSWGAPVVTGGVTGGSAQTGQISIGQVLTNPTNVNQTATYTVTPTSGAAGACVGSTFTVTVTVNPAPAIPDQTVAICSGTAFSIAPVNNTPTAATVVPSGTTYTWTTPVATGGVTGGSAQAIGQTSISQTLTNPTNSPQTVTYTVTPTSGASGSCVGPDFTITVTVNPVPAIPAQVATVCSGTAFTVNPANGVPSAATIVPAGTTYTWAAPVVTGGLTGGSAQAVGQPNISQTLTNPTNSTQVATYTVTPKSGSCTGTNFTIIVSVSPQPAIPNQSTSICSGASFTISPTDGVPTAATIVPSGTTYTWPAPAVTGGVTGASAQAVPQPTISQTLTNPTNTPQTVTYTVTPTSGSCTGATFTVVINVNPKPAIPDQTPTICSGTSFTVSPADGSPTAATIVPAGTTYSWPVPVVTGGVTGAAAASGQASISQTLTNPTNTPQTATYTVTPTSGATGSCVGATFTITVTVNPKPAIPAQSPTICSGASFTVSPADGIPTAATIVPAGTTYTWPAPAVTGGVTGASAQAVGVASISQTLTNPTNTVQTVTYTVTPTSGAAGSCVGSTFTITVTVNPKPVIPAQTATICSGALFAVTPVNSVPTAATIVPTGTTYTWPTPVVTGGITGATAQLVGVASISQTLTNPTNVPQTATYTVTPTSGAAGSCVGATFTVTVTVNPQPVIPNQTTSICSGTAFSVTPANGVPTSATIVPASTTYTWLAPVVTGGLLGGSAQPAPQASISQTLTNPTNTPQTATYTVTPTSGAAGSCVGASFTVTVTVNPKPAIPNQTPAICSGSAFTVSPSDGLPTAATIVPSGTTYTWPAPAVTGGVTGSSAQLTGVTSISQTLTNPTNTVQTVTYTVTPTSGAAGSCVGSTFTVTVTVNPQPVIPNQTATICSGNAFTINPINGSPTAATIVPSGTTYSWAVPIVTGGVTGGSAQSGQASISQTLTNPTNTVQTATYTVTPTSGAAGSCVGATFTITVTVNPKPVIPSQTTAICSGASFSITPVDGIPSSATIVPAGTTYTWTAPVVTGGVTGSSAQAVGVASISQTLTNPTNAVQTVTYTVTPTSGAAGACVGATFTVTVTVNPKPSIPNQSPAICSGTAFSVSPTDGVPTAATIVPTNTTYTWPSPVVTGGITGASAQTSQTSISQTLVNPTNSVQTATYTVTPTSGAAGACVGTPFTIVVSVNPVPAIAAQTATICSGTAFNVTPVNGTPSAATIVPAGTTYAWAVPIVTGGITGGSAQTGQTSISQTLTNPTNSVQSATYTVTPTSGAAGACVGSVFTVTVTVNPKPVIPDQTQTVCSGVAFNISPTDGVPTSATIVPPSTKYTWTAPVVTGGMTGGSAQAVPQNSVTQTLTNPTAVAQTATYTVTPISGAAGSCVGATFQVVVTVNPVPKAQAVSSIDRCSGTAINLNLMDIINNVAPFAGGNSVNAIFSYTVLADFPLDVAPAVFPGTFDRVVASAANITNSFTNVSNHDVTLSFTVTPYSVIGNCAGTPFTLNVVYHPEPVGSNLTQTGCASTLNHNIQTSQITNGLASVFTYTVSSSDEVNVPTPPALDRVVASNALITDTFNNPTSSVVTITYTITPYNAANPTCAGLPFTYKVDIGSSPIGTSDTKAAVCSDVLFTIDPQNNITNGVISTFTWTAVYDAGLTGGAASGSGIISMALTNTSNVQKNVTFTITPTAGPCPGTPATFTIVKPIDPEPVMDPTLATKTICSTNPTSTNKVNIVLNTNGVSVAAANYNITLKSQDPSLTGTPTTGVGLAATAIQNDTYNNVTALPLNVVYTIVPVAAGGCLGDPFDITVTVNPEPVISNALSNTVCSTDISNIILSTNGVSVGAASYRLVNVTVPGGLTPNAGNTAVGTISGINMIKGDSYTNSTNSPITVIYDIRATSPSACEGASRLINLTVNPAPVLDPALNPTPVCSGVASGVTLGVAPGSVAASTYNINSILFPGLTAGGSNTGIGSGKAANAMFNDVYVNTTSSPLTATYKIAPVSALGCIGPVGTVTLTINPSPDLDNNLGKTVCSTNASGITFTTTAASVVAANYNLIGVTITGGLTAGGGNAAFPATGVAANYIAADTYTNPGDVTLTVTYRVEPVSGAGCKGPQEDIVLTVEPTIKAAPVNHNPTICSNSTAVPTATDIELLSPTVPSAGTITFNYTAVSSVGAQITGFVPSLTNLAAGYRIQDALVNNSNNSATVTYTITPVAAGAKGGAGCNGAPAIVVVNVEPRPKLVPSPLTKTVCEGSPIGIALTTTTVPSAGTVEYLLLSAVATGGVTGMSPVGTVFAAVSTLNDNLSSPSTTTESVTYTFRPRINGGAGCIGDNVSVTVNVNPRPNISAVGVPAAICSGDQINISIVSDVSSTVSTWPSPTITPTAASVTGGSAGAGDQLFQILFNKTSPLVQTVSYTVTPQASGCAGTPITINIPVNPVPNVLGTATTTICSGGTLNVPLSSKVAAGVNFTWTVDDPSNIGGAPGVFDGSGTTINQVFTNNTGSQASLTYTITPILTAPGTTSGTCTGDTKIMFVTVAPSISAAFLNTPSPDYICAGSTEYLVFQFGGQAPFDFTYTKQGPTGPAVPSTLTNKGPVVVVQDALSVAGAYTYTITSVTSHVNGVSCTTPFNIPFVVNVGDTDPNFTIVGPAAACSPNTVTFQYNEVAGVTYTWRFGDSPDFVYTATSTTPNKTIQHVYTNLSPTSTLNYPVTLQTELPAPYPGCFKSSSPKTVTIYPNIIANIIADKTSICSGESIRFSNQSVGATSQNWSYRVQGQVPETALGTSLNITSVFTNNTTQNPITYEVIYRGTNGNCPTPDQVIPIKVYRQSTAAFNEGTVPPYVNGQSIVNFTNTSSIIDGADFTYDWSFGSDASPASVTAVAPSAVTYVRPGPKDVILTVTNTQNAFCKSTFEKTIDVNLLPLVATFKASPTESCFPSKIVVTESNITGDVIEWRVYDANGRTAATSSAVLPTFNIPSEGKYTITLKTSSSLTGQFANAQNQTVTVYAKPFASFDARPDVLYVPDTELTTFNFSTGANQYSWDFGDGGKSVEEEPKYVYKIEGIYDIQMIAMYDHGNNVVCADTLTHKVVAKQGGVTKVPNAFTPNPAGPSGGVSGSGSFNDVFLPIVKGAEEFNLQIFDRWGNLIFESNNSQIGWDGYNIDGRLLPAGVYVYKLTIRLSDGQRSTQIGDVTMIR